MIDRNTKLLCLLCQESEIYGISFAKRCYGTQYKIISQRSEEQLIELNDTRAEKTNLSYNYNIKFVGKFNLVTAGFAVSIIIARHGKPSSVGEFLKQT